MKSESIKKFLYILPFMGLLATFAYYPLYGWVYAFFDYTPRIVSKKSSNALQQSIIYTNGKKVDLQ